MSVTTYTTVNGRILRQNKDGVVHNFVSDPLGSVVMVRDTSGNTVYTAEYDPYGNVQSETGTNPSEFGYVGTLGYVKDSASSLYVRARYLLPNLGRWLTKDPLWPSEPGFVYAEAAPTVQTDTSGTSCYTEKKSFGKWKRSSSFISDCMVDCFGLNFCGMPILPGREIVVRVFIAPEDSAPRDIIIGLICAVVGGPLGLICAVVVGLWILLRLACTKADGSACVESRQYCFLPREDKCCVGFPGGPPKQ